MGHSWPGPALISGAVRKTTLTKVRNQYRRFRGQSTIAENVGNARAGGDFTLTAEFSGNFWKLTLYVAANNSDMIKSVFIRKDKGGGQKHIRFFKNQGIKGA